MLGHEPCAGQRVGRYVLESHLGSGGFASVWLARDADRRAFVIKLMRADIAVDSSARARFAREVEVLTGLDHPGIVRIVDHDLAASSPYLVMDRVVGQTLRDRLVECSTMDRPLSIAAVVSMVRGMADAIAYAHESGVIHRDLKPANVLLDVADAPRVLDFGMARLMGADRHAATTLGRIMGTRYYWAPEQAQGEEATPATDQFCLATVAFEMLALRRAWVRGEGGAEAAPVHRAAPLELNQPLAILERLRSGQRPSVSRYRAGLSAAVDEVLARAWAADPVDRYLGVRAFEAAFSHALDDKSAEGRGPIEGTRILETRVLETTVTPARLAASPSPRSASAEAGMTSDLGATLSGAHGRPRARGAAVVVGLGVLGLGVVAYLLAGEGRGRAVEVEPPVIGARAPAAFDASHEAAPITARTATVSGLVAATPASDPTPPRAGAAMTSRARPTADPRPPRSKSPSPAPVARRGADLHARLDALAARPDLVQLAAFADQLDALAERIPDPDIRARVRRLVATGSAVGDVARLRQALTELERGGALD